MFARSSLRRFFKFQTFSSRRCDPCGPKIVQIRAILANFPSFEDFLFLAVSTGVGVNRYRVAPLLYFISQTIFYPSARILPRILPKSFRKILPRNPSINAYSALKILPRDPSAKILPRQSANKKISYFFGSFRSLPQNPSAESFHKCLFCIENPSAESFRKILPQKLTDFLNQL